MDMGRSMSDSKDTDGRGGGGGANLRVVNLEDVEGSPIAPGWGRVVDADLASLWDVGCFSSTCEQDCETR